ncbi:MAG: AAA family ATPase [Nanoarchaeota archaeon]
MKKIAVIGTHGIRKTTICHTIVARLKELGRNADILQEVARRSPFPVNEGTTPDAQRWILHTQIASEIAAGVYGVDYLVCDRGSLDNYAYFVRAFGRDSVLDVLVREHAKTYSSIVYVPLVETTPLEHDGFRSTDPDFQRVIDRHIQEMLRDFEIPHVKFKGVDELIPIILNY